MKFHNNHNSSILHQYIINETNNIQIIILELITLFTEILILLFISSILFEIALAPRRSFCDDQRRNALSLARRRS